MYKILVYETSKKRSAQKVWAKDLVHEKIF